MRNEIKSKTIVHNIIDTVQNSSKICVANMLMIFWFDTFIYVGSWINFLFCPQSFDFFLQTHTQIEKEKRLLSLLCNVHNQIYFVGQKYFWQFTCTSVMSVSRTEFQDANVSTRHKFFPHSFFVPSSLSNFHIRSLFAFCFYENAKKYRLPFEIEVREQQKKTMYTFNSVVLSGDYWM